MTASTSWSFPYDTHSWSWTEEKLEQNAPTLRNKTIRPNKSFNNQHVNRAYTCAGCKCFAPRDSDEGENSDTPVGLPSRKLVDRIRSSPGRSMDRHRASGTLYH